MSELAKRVRAARGYAGFTQRQLADRIGLDVQAIKRTEAGRRDPKEPEQRAIAEECGLPREFFFVDLSRLPELAVPKEDLVSLYDVDISAVRGNTDEQQLAAMLDETRKSVRRLLHGALEGNLSEDTAEPVTEATAAADAADAQARGARPARTSAPGSAKGSSRVGR